MSLEPVAFGRATVSDCEREQIHIPGSIQPHGCLIAMAPGDLRVHYAGGDTFALLGVAPEALLRAPFSTHAGPAMTAAIQARAGDAPQTRRLITFETGDGRTLDGAIHGSDGLLILELEPPLPDAEEQADLLGLVQGLVQRIQNAESTQLLCQAVTEGVHTVCGFDRVMVYRFLQDDSGSVIAETHHEDMEPYLGLRYPASDIPAQARDLYVRNRIRLIADARYTPAPLVASPDARQPLDLTMSVLRSVSPIHLEYLANMGVAASMSLSIVIDGKLWGLIACHHRTPRFVSPKQRTALELFSQIISFQLETKSAAEDYAVRLRSKVFQEGLVKDLSHERDLVEGLDRSKRSLLEYIPASGLALWIDGVFSAIGATPPEAEVKALVAWLNASVTEGVFYTEKLSAHYPRAESFAATASGILALSVSRTPRDYLIWFRPELVQTVRWAGDPNKAVASAGDRLSPRSSFADWQELVRLQSEPWSMVDIKTSQSLRVSLLEIVLEHVDQLARERERARIQQDALLAELDLRIVQWEQTAEQLKVEGDRRAVLETELSQVLRRTVVEQESERQRIARELHDSLGQYLTIMQLDLDRIGRDVSASDSVRERVDRLKTLTADVGAEVGHLAWEIRPTALDDLGLQTAIQQLLEEWSERRALLFDLHLALHDRRLSPPIETALYRVLQEAVLNVVKHAAATRVGVILDANESEVRLIVEDDGKGFRWDETEGASAPPRLGLLGMRERLALLGGSLEIETSPGAGTTLLIHVPL